MRVMLSKLMLSKANVLVLDDPTNHLDLESITALNDGLMAFTGSILLLHMTTNLSNISEPNYCCF